VSRLMASRFRSAHLIGSSAPTSVLLARPVAARAAGIVRRFVEVRARVLRTLNRSRSSTRVAETRVRETGDGDNSTHTLRSRHGCGEKKTCPPRSAGKAKKGEGGRLHGVIVEIFSISARTLVSIGILVSLQHEKTRNLYARLQRIHKHRRN
jgi:hypothetical protein